MDCLENLMKRMMKHIGCRRMILDFFEKLLAVELREYNKNPKILKFLNTISQPVVKERMSMEVEKFDTFFTKNVGTEKKGELGETLERLREKLRESYRTDPDLELIDNRYLLIAYKK